MKVDGLEVEKALERMREHALKLQRRAAKLPASDIGLHVLEAEALGIEWAAGVLQRAMDKRPAARVVRLAWANGKSQREVARG